MARRGRPRSGAGEERNPAAQIFALTLARSIGLAALRSAVQLEVFDHLGKKPRKASDLARELDLNTDRLRRLLRVLSNQGLVREAPRDQFAASRLGLRLRRDSTEPYRDFVLFSLHPFRQRALEELDRAVRSGQTVAEIAYGKPEWDSMREQPEFRELFQRGMCNLTATVARDLLRAYSFGRASRIADIGGGHGGLLAPLLVALPRATGVLLDLPMNAEGARQHFAELGLSKRCEIVGQSFFDGVPSGADLYLLKSVLHNWDDDSARRILGSIARAMPRKGKLLIIEALLPADRGPSLVHTMDLNMMAFPGGRERTEAEYRELCAAAGLRETRAIPLGNYRWAIEAVPSSAPRART